MTSEVASLLEHDPVLKPSKRDGSPCLEPISESSLSTASSHSLLSDLEDCNYLVDEPPTSATTTDLNLEEKEPTSDPVRKPSKLRWGSVDVRIFPIIPGDHPDCERGPPLTIAWDHVGEMSVSLDEFEEERKGDRYEGNDLILGWLDRRYKLRRLGFDDDELKHASKQARHFRRQREWTLFRITKNERFAMLQESLMRKLNRGFRPKKKLVTRY